MFYIAVFLIGAGAVALIHFLIRVHFEGKRFLEYETPKFSKYLTRDGDPFPFSVDCPKCSVPVKVGPAGTNEYCYCCQTQFLAWFSNNKFTYKNIKYNVKEYEYVRESNG